MTSWHSLVACVAAVQMVGQATIVRSVLRQIVVEKHDRNDVPRDAAHLVLPRAQLDAAMLDLDRYPWHELGQTLGDCAFDRLSV